MKHNSLQFLVHCFQWSLNQAAGVRDLLQEFVF